MIHKTIKPLHYLSILFLIFLFSTNFVQAQEDNLTSSFNKNRYLKIEFSCLGGNIDLSGSGSDLLGQRSVLGFAGSFLRVTHLFSNKWGWYAGTEMNLVKEKNSPYYNASFGDAVGEVMRRVLFGGFTPTVGADAGMVYRVEKKNWDINPRLGMGLGTLFLFDLESDKNKIQEDGTTERTMYKQRTGTNLFIKTGVSANYFYGKRSFVSLNLGIQQPLEKTYGELSVLIDDTQKEFKKYSSRKPGRDLSITIGYGLVLGKRKVSYR